MNHLQVFNKTRPEKTRINQYRAAGERKKESVFNQFAECKQFQVRHYLLEVELTLM